MGNPLRTEAIKNFLLAKTHVDLAALYTSAQEIQVNVAQDGGTRVDGDFKGRQWHGWSDGFTTWKSFRIPLKANTEPEYEDRPMNFDLADHAEGIGMTGWDWQARLSRWVAFDFDGITGHSEKHAKRLSEAELEEIKQRLFTIPWCTLRKSTSGKGLHLYVFLQPVPTQNHTEHAALARAILGMLSAVTRYDFTAKVDTCGGNMWVWHRKMVGTDGLELLQAQSQLLAEPPVNWKDHITVIAGKRRKILPEFIVTEQQQNTSDMDRIFEELVGQSNRIPLDDDHTRLLDWLRTNKCNAWWDADHHMLVTHTYHLLEAHKSLSLRGLFETMAQGSEAPSDHNCFLFPTRGGGWSVRRYTLGVAEAKTWDQDGQGWTRCFYNRAPDLKTAARAFEGAENERGGFTFRNAELAQKAALLLGAKIDLPNWITIRPAILKEHKDGRLVIQIDKEDSDSKNVNISETMGGWVADRKSYTRIIDSRPSDQADESGVLDEITRHLISQAGDDCGWVVRTPDTPWRIEPLTHVKLFLQSIGYSMKEVTSIVGASIARCWTLVNKPFQDEYPLGREWNRNAAQFKFKPTQEKDNLKFPTWLKILQHCGQNLDRDVKAHAWCQSNGIMTGSDYLKCWIASLFQQPLEPLPYLFFYSQDQNTGKSIFHEALRLLVTHGVVRADQALTSQFNGELANAIVCVVEETDLKRNKQAYNKIKDWVTAKELSIRALYESPYMIPNATHWVQCSNDHLACPVFPGDTRITYINVPALDPSELIPKKILFPLLEKEAPDFISELLSLELPPTTERLNLPVIATQEKHIAVRANRSLLEEFIDETCHHVTGHMIKFSDFFDRLRDWLDPSDIRNWTKVRVGRELPPKYPKGRVARDNGQLYIGNISFEAFKTGDDVLPRLILKDERLVPEA